MSKMMRITDATAENLNALVEMIGESKQRIMERAVEAFRREQFFKQTNEQFERLKADPEAWAEMEQERKEWETLLGDVLDDE